MMKSGSSLGGGGTATAEKSENSDAIKRLYRGASELVRNLDKINRNVVSLDDVCRSNVNGLRTRLRETCERLMFLDPVGHGKKAEDLLWRKVYYDFVLTAKNVRKNAPLSESDQHRLTNHISLGIGTYHHLLFRLQSEFSLPVEGCADFLVLSDLRGTAKDKSDSAKKKDLKDEEVNKWAIQAFQRCLICMGDLTRYDQELGIRSVASISVRYYHQALLVSTQQQSSMPHNQLGTLVGTRNHNCDAAYNYMRCVMYDNGFEGAHGNLNRIFEKNQSSLVELAIDVYENGDSTCGRDMQVKKFFIDFLQYCEVCFKFQNSNPNVAIENFCEVVHQEFKKCLEITLEVERPETEVESPDYLSDSIIFKFFVMNLMCIERLEKCGSTDSSAATALTLTALSHLLRHILLVVKGKLFGNETSQDAKKPKENVSQTDHQLTDNRSENIREISEVKLLATRKRSKKSNLRGRRKLRESLSTDDSDASDKDATSDSDSDGCSERRASDISEGGEASENSSCSSGDEKPRDEDEKKTTKSPINGLKDAGHVSSDFDSDDATKATDNGIDSKSIDVDEEISFEKFNFSDLDATLVFEVLLNDSLLSVVKVCVDWLKSHSTLIAATAQGSQKFCSRFVTLLNVLSKLEAVIVSDGPVDLLSAVGTASSSADFKQKWPLAEDVALIGFGLLSKAHESIDFSLRTSVWLSQKEEVLLRMASVRQLGCLMAECDGSYVTLDGRSGTFSIGPVLPSSSDAKQKIGKKRNDFKATRRRNGGRGEKKVRDRKKHLMQNMAQLWLEAEVKELESSLKSTGKPTFSPYLIPDCAVLTDHLPLLKQMMSSKVFIFILPTTVIQSLDDMKKESSKAREAIRWLEGEFQKRNRYLRAQKRHERLVLSMLKYPKRKEKEAWNMFAVLECCNYFARQGSAPNDVSPNLVTILTSGVATTTTKAAATNSEKSNSSMFVLANSLGLKVENVEDLHSRWAKGAKNKAERK